MLPQAGCTRSCSGPPASTSPGPVATSKDVARQERPHVAAAWPAPAQPHFRPPGPHPAAQATAEWGRAPDGRTWAAASSSRKRSPTPTADTSTLILGALGGADPGASSRRTACDLRRGLGMPEELRLGRPPLAALHSRSPLRHMLDLTATLLQAASWLQVGGQERFWGCLSAGCLQVACLPPSSSPPCAGC